MLLKQTSLDQTGVAYIETEKGDKLIPLFSLKPIEEAQELAEYIAGWKRIKQVFTTNNLSGYKTENAIRDFQEERGSDVLPEDLIYDLVSGFSLVKGFESRYYPGIYC